MHLSLEPNEYEIPKAWLQSFFNSLFTDLQTNQPKGSNWQNVQVTLMYTTRRNVPTMGGIFALFLFKSLNAQNPMFLSPHRPGPPFYCTAVDGGAGTFFFRLFGSL